MNSKKNRSKSQTEHPSPRLAQIGASALLAGLVLLLFAGGLSQAAPSSYPAASYNQTVAGILTQITTQTLSYDLAGLTGERPVLVGGTFYTITTRNSYKSGVVTATQYAYEEMEALGLDVSYHEYTYGSYHWRNVVGEKPGQDDPDQIYLITAHIDDMPGTFFSPAPGADDNGSGSIAVLTAARLLAPHDFAYTLRFVLFTGEEQGLRGSEAYASDCYIQGEDIRGVVNLDMIAYNSDDNLSIDLWGKSDMAESLALTSLFAQVVDQYGLGLDPDFFSAASGFPLENSDHWSFLVYGYPAMMAIEDNDDFTPYYHTAADTLSTLDLDYYADFTRAAVATIAHLGGVDQAIFLPWIAVAP
jgi:Zn-dependent M28 family amino/carboxypeptidase